VGLTVKARTGGLSARKILEGTILADKKVDLLDMKVVGKSRGERISGRKVGGMMKPEGKTQIGEKISGNMNLEAKKSDDLTRIANKKRGARNRVALKIVDALVNIQDSHQNETKGEEVLNVKREKEILHLVVLKTKDEVNIEKNENIGNGMWTTIIKVRYRDAQVLI